MMLPIDKITAPLTVRTTTLKHKVITIQRKTQNISTAIFKQQHTLTFSKRPPLNYNEVVM